VHSNAKGRYEGAWRAGLQHGAGAWEMAAGALAAAEPHHVVSYAGDWAHGKYHGAGASVHKDGTKYAGGFQLGMQHGHGTKTYTNGDVYVGDVVRGGFEGYGRYTFAASATAYEGEWMNSWRHGQGTYNYPDGAPTARCARLRCAFVLMCVLTCADAYRASWLRAV
jgi:hypothetical protein